MVTETRGVVGFGGSSYLSLGALPEEYHPKVYRNVVGPYGGLQYTFLVSAEGNL